MQAMLTQVNSHVTPTTRIRDPKTVPLYCRPVPLFFLEWGLMLAAFSLRISYSSFPDFSVAAFLFALASASFLLGFFTHRLFHRARGFVPLGASETYSVNRSRLRLIHAVGVSIVLAIIVMNWKRFGLPPIFALGGADTLDYQEYGSLRQPMFALVMILFVSAPLESSFWRRWLLYVFSPACFLLYGSRGFLLIMLFQALAVFSLRTQKSKAFIYFTAAATLLSGVLLSNAIGNNRNSLGVDALLGYLQIRPKFYDWPAAYLWVISYISTPISNMCWIVKVYHYTHPSFNFLYSALPAFWTSLSIEQTADLGSEKIIDGVHTYMAKYYIDFWYFGIVGINYIWGLIASAISAGNRLTRNFLVSAILLSCMGFMFFSDFLTILIVMLEIAAAFWIQKHVLIPRSPTLNMAAEQRLE